MSEIITGVCAWCEALKPEEERDHRENISHGCCPAHVLELKAAIAAKRAQMEAQRA